ncbi:hypothetical protein JCM24511_02935 [Saitozyma sp. JCM 24511]|nr:hypothetical protein JCM24511_02935 [Saitozyma sp. JCM 24511]
MAGLQIEKVVTALRPIHVTARDHPDTTFIFRSVPSLTQGDLVYLDVDPRVIITHKGEDGTLSTTRRRTKFSDRHLAYALAGASYYVFADLEERGLTQRDISSREKAELLTSELQDHLGKVFRDRSMNRGNVLVWDDSEPSQTRIRWPVRGDALTQPDFDHLVIGVSRMSQREIASMYQHLSSGHGWGDVQVNFPELQEMIDHERSDVDDTLVLVRGTDYDGQDEIMEDAQDGNQVEGPQVIDRSRIVRIPEDLAPHGTPLLPTASSLPSRSDMELASQQRSQQLSRASALASSEPSGSSEVSSEWSAQMTPTESSTSSGQATPRPTPPPSVGVSSSEEQESDLVEVFKALLVHE